MICAFPDLISRNLFPIYTFKNIFTFSLKSYEFLFLRQFFNSAVIYFYEWCEQAGNLFQMDSQLSLPGDTHSALNSKGQLAKPSSSKKMPRERV